MAFGQQTPREYIEDKHGELQRAVNNALAGDVTVVSVVSINDCEAGQMIMADTRYDKSQLAARLRLCADILDPVTPYFVKTTSTPSPPTTATTTRRGRRTSWRSLSS